MTTRTKDGDREALSRRDFVKAGVAGGTLVLGGAGLAASAAAAETAAAATSDAPVTAPAAPPFELEELTIAQLQEGMVSGRFTAGALVAAYLARIDALNTQGPQLRAVIEVDPDAPAVADGARRERREKGPRGPLHGIPILLKDNIGTHDRMTTTAGSLALAGSIPPRDAFIAARLREAGAVLLGKANLSEWANFRSAPLDQRLEQPWRPVPQPLRAGPQPVRLQLGLGGGGRGQPLRRGVGTRDRRLDRLPRLALRHRRHQAHPRPVEPRRHHPHRPQPGHRRSDGAHGGRRGGAARRARRRRPARRGDRGERGKAHPDYTQFLDPDGLRGARIGVFRPASLEDNPQRRRRARPKRSRR